MAPSSVGRPLGGRLRVLLTVAVLGGALALGPGPAPAGAGLLPDEFSVDNVTMAEGSGGGTTPFVFTVTRSNLLLNLEATSVQFKTVDGTAKAGSDYTAVDGIVNFGLGESSRQVTVPVTADSTAEPNEAFVVTLVPVDAEDSCPAPCQGVGTINNDDAAPLPQGPKLTVNDVTLTEGNEGTKDATFKVTLSPATATPVTVKYATADGTADSSDYEPTSGTLTFSPGEFTKDVVVKVKGDTVAESNETFTLRLSEPSGAQVADNEGLGVIVDDDGAQLPPKSGQGYTLVGADGGIFNFGSSSFYGSMGDQRLNQPVIGLAHTPTGLGYWLVARDGGIFTFGDAKFLGSMGDKRLNAPVLGMEPTPTGNGYFLFAADGGIFTFGDAQFLGSTGDRRLNAPVSGMARTPNGQGYWLVAEDGGVFTFGNAAFHGSTGDRKLNQPVFDMAASAGGNGYWLVAKDGGVFTFGNAEFLGSAVGQVTGRAVGIGATSTAKGYWIADSRGAVHPFGDAAGLGDRRNAANNAEMVGFAVVR